MCLVSHASRNSGKAHNLIPATMDGSRHSIGCTSGREHMIELGLLVPGVCIGAFWLLAALIGRLFKLTFGRLGALFGGMFALFGIGLAALVVVPILALALLPLLIPALGLALLVWLIVHATRKPVPAPAPVSHP